MDGDGLPDTVSVSHQGRLLISLGSGTTVRHLVAGGTVLEGLAGVGTTGLDIATSTGTEDGSNGSEWTVWHLSGASLTTVRMRHRAVLVTDPGNNVVWISDHTLYDGIPDNLRQGQDRVAVLARSWALRDGRLASTRGGVRCWDRSTGKPPTRCTSGQDWRYDVGPYGDLPSLQPIGASWFRPAAGPVVDGSDSWTLDRATPPGPPESPHMDLVLRSGDLTAHVLVPAGWPPVLRPRTVAPGGVSGVLISQEGGDSDTWRVYVDHDGRPVELPAQGPIALGGGFAPGTGAAYLSWVAADGSLFTRVGTARPGHYRVYAWAPDGSTSVPTLQAHDLGVACFDDLFGTYGTCAD